MAELSENNRTEKLVNQTVSNRYLIHSLLGHQVGRRTFLATDLQTQTSVVLKLLLFGPDFTWEDLKLFEREAVTLKSLSHPAIPNYLDSFDLDTELGQGFALVQSYIEAQSLQHWVESGRTFNEVDFKNIATQLLEVLIYLHSRQPPVIHRDIKPSNILLSDRSGHNSGQIYLVDFGSVQTVAHGGTITVVGTYGYMPPEQFGGRTTPASDLYSLGATLIYVLTGAHPADLPKRRGILQFDAGAQISQACQAWLQGMIQPEVEERFTTAQQALEALQKENFSLQTAQSIPTKPKGSRVILNKTEDQLEIVIPALTARGRLKVIQRAIVYTILINSPLLAFVAIFINSPSLIWLLVPLLSWGVFRVWESALYTCFEEIQVLIRDQQIIYLSRRWLGKDQSYAALIKEITRLESSTVEYSYNPKFEVTHLNIWIGNHCCPLSSPKSLDNLRRLTRPEVDWLSFELSEWLGIPVQKIGGDKPENDLSQPGTKAVSSSNSTQHKNETSPDDLLHKLNLQDLQKIQRPQNAKCIVNKTSETMEISTAAPLIVAFFPLGCIMCFFGIPYFLLIVASALSNPFIAILLGIFPLMLWRIIKYFSKIIDPGNILLVITRQDASLIKQRGQEKDFRKCLQKVPLSSIQSIQVVHFSSYKNYFNYHVQLKVGKFNFSPGYTDIVVGNRRFWLSRQEAFWLASELSNWLKLPVTEMEVVQNNK
jgi:serine/threonine protein kinase